MKKIDKKLTILLFSLIVSIAIAMSFLFRVDPDYFWHITAGDYMLQHGILKHDIFSWFVSGKYWMSHEWLFEVFLSSLKGLFGSIHPFIYCLLGFLSLLLILFIPNKNGILKNIPYTLIYLLFFFLLFLGNIQARPHLLSFSFLALTIWFLVDNYQNEDSKKIFFLPLLTILWANFHGGSSNLSYLFCLIFFLGGLFSFQFKKIEAKRLSKKKLKKYFIVMILCMIAININIHGVKMFLYPYINMMDTTMIQNISEWQSTSLNEWYHYFYYLFLLFMIFTMLFSEKKIQFMDLILLGVVSYLGLKSIRFWGYTYIVMSYVIFSYVSYRKRDYGTDVVLGLLTISILVISIILSFSFFPISYQNYLEEDVFMKIKEEKPSRLFNMYGYGGELIYHQIPVFIDGRADLYGKYNYQDYLNISMLQRDYVSLIQKYDFDYFLVEEGYPIAYYLKYSEEYEKILHQGDALLYRRIVQ